MESWKTGAPLCWPNCCPVAQCRSWATAAALRGRRSLHLQSGMYHFPKTASVSQNHPAISNVSLISLGKILIFSCSPRAEADSLQQISLQTLNADPFLKRSVTAGTCSPPPTSPSLLSRGSYSSVLNSNRYPLVQIRSRFTLKPTIVVHTTLNTERTNVHLPKRHQTDRPSDLWCSLRLHTCFLVSCVH